MQCPHWEDVKSDFWAEASRGWQAGAWWGVGVAAGRYRSGHPLSWGCKVTN